MCAPGEVPEWSKGHDWKSCERKRSEGSNPSLSSNPVPPIAAAANMVPSTHAAGYRCSLPGLAGFISVMPPGTAEAFDTKSL